MKGYYQKRIHQLETELERRQREIAKERKAREEAERYIYELLRHMGGHALIWTRNLGRQKWKGDLQRGPETRNRAYENCIR